MSDQGELPLTVRVGDKVRPGVVAVVLGGGGDFYGTRVEVSPAGPG